MAPVSHADSDRNTTCLEGFDPAILEQIASPAIDLVVWRRSLPMELRTWLEEEASERLPSGRILVRLNQLEGAVTALVGQDGATAGALQLLARDIIDLSRRFAKIVGTRQLDIRLDVIQRDACWRFHRDATCVRLLTTYRGPGTQIPPANSAEQALREQRKYRGPLTELPRHAVAIFRGDPNDCGRGVLHRSPPVAGTGITRLLLCLNPPIGTSPEM